METFSFKDNKKKSIIDDFIEKYQVDSAGTHHVADCVRNLSVDDQLDLFKEKILALLKFAYIHDFRVQLCRTKYDSDPYDFTELSIEVPNEYTNIVVTCDDGTIDDDPLVEILFTIQKIHPGSFISTVDDFGNTMFRAGCAEIWVSYSTFNWASVGIECRGGEGCIVNYDPEIKNQIVTDEMVIDADICEAIEKVLKEVHDIIQADNDWHAWFILQGIDIDEVFLWDLSH